MLRYVVFFSCLLFSALGAPLPPPIYWNGNSTRSNHGRFAVEGGGTELKEVWSVGVTANIWDGEPDDALIDSSGRILIGIYDGNEAVDEGWQYWPVSYAIDSETGALTQVTGSGFTPPSYQSLPGHACVFGNSSRALVDFIAYDLSDSNTFTEVWSLGDGQSFYYPSHCLFNMDMSDFNVDGTPTGPMLVSYYDENGDTFVGEISYDGTIGKKWTYGSYPGIRALAALSPNKAFPKGLWIINEGYLNSYNDGTIYLINRATELVISNETGKSPVVYGDSVVYFVSGDSNDDGGALSVVSVDCSSSTLSTSWTFQTTGFEFVGASIVMSAIDSAGHIVFGTSKYRFSPTSTTLVAVDLDTGKESWSVSPEFSRTPAAMATDTNNRIYLTDNRLLYVQSAIDGSRIGSYVWSNTHNDANNLLISERYLIVVSGTFVKAFAMTGTPSSPSPSPSPSSFSPLSNYQHSGEVLLAIAAVLFVGFPAAIIFLRIRGRRPLPCGIRIPCYTPDSNYDTLA